MHPMKRPRRRVWRTVVSALAGSGLTAASLSGQLSSIALGAAVPTGPKSRSSSSTKPVRPLPTVTTASTRPASVIASARSPRRKAIASKVNLPTVILQRRWSESAPTWRMPYTRTSRRSRCGRGLSAAIRCENAWTYVFGGLEASRDGLTLIAGARLLAQAADGIMPWRGRPEPLKRGLVARLPPIDFREESP